MPTLAVGTMYETKLIQLFIRFSPEEKRRLRKWVVSDFVNKNEDVIRFFGFIDSRTAINELTVTKERAHEYLYPNTPFNDLRIRHLIWMATEVFETFIAFNQFQGESSLKEQLLARYYSDKELFKYANQHIEAGIVHAEKLPLRNGDYFVGQYKLYSEFFHVNSRNNRSEDFKLQEIIDNAAMFTMIETLKYACIIHSLQKISALKIENHLLEPILAVIRNPRFMEITAVRIYYHIYRVITEEDETAFEVFIKDIKENNHCFAPHDLKDLYLLAINFCIKKSNQNMEHYTRMAFELYVYAIGKGFLLEHNEISRFSFTNVVTLGIKLKEYGETEQFVKNFSNLIASEYRQNTIDFNTAKLLYSREQHKKALKILLTNEFKDAIWNLNAKYLLLKIFFESDDMESFDSYLRSFKLYVKRKSNIGYHKNYFTDLLKGLSQLQEIYNKPAKRKGFSFPKETPDVDWFNKALDRMRARA